MRVIWTPEAQQDRADVWDYIAADNPRAAARIDELFSDAAARNMLMVGIAESPRFKNLSVSNRLPRPDRSAACATPKRLRRPNTEGTTQLYRTSRT